MGYHGRCCLLLALTNKVKGCCVVFETGIIEGALRKMDRTIRLPNDTHRSLNRFALFFSGIEFEVVCEP
jgi:hypothetical protein